MEKAEEIKAFVEPKDVAVVGFFTDKESELAKAFISTAEALDDIEFAISTPEASGEYEVKEDAIVVLKKVLFLSVEAAVPLNSHIFLHFLHFSGSRK